MTKIEETGTALPRMVHEGKRVPSFDEDATTLAVAAARGLEPASTLVVIGNADEEVLSTAIGHDGETARATDLREALEEAGDDGIVVESYAPRMGDAWGAAVRTGPDGDDPPGQLADLLPGDAPGVEVPLDVVNRHVEAFDVTGDEQTPMGAYVSPQVYRDSLDARYRLVGRRCGNGHLIFPPKPKCPECGTRGLSPEPLSGRGTVYSVTVIGKGAAPAEFTTQNQSLGAYGVAIVELAEGPRIVAQLTDCDPEEVAIGHGVEAVFRRIYVQRDGVRYGYKFRPWGGLKGED